VYVIGVSEGKELRTIETINVELSPRQPAGMTPSALALSPDAQRLYVVCSDANAVAVADVSENRSRVLGFIPTGWYPTAARVLSDGRLLVLNGRGDGTRPKPSGSSPSYLPTGERNLRHTGVVQPGSMSIVDPFDDAKLEEYTETVRKNSGIEQRAVPPIGGPIPSGLGEISPIEHVIYIVKEDRSYDEILGDIGNGKSSPSLVKFGEDVTPNHHKIAKEFVLLDNFYVNGDSDADGLNWAVSAIAPAYVQKLWQNSAARRRNHNDYEGGEPAATPPAGTIWSNAIAAGRSVRNYGFATVNVPKADQTGVQIKEVLDPALKPVTNMSYRGIDLDYPDIERAKVFVRDLAGFEQQGTMPRLIVMRLGNDRTSGLEPGKISPRSAIADNDVALGLIVEAVSKSRFWTKTAIFIVEDDAQGGLDHIDSRRAPAFVISPYARRESIDSTMYNTTSMLRTIELLLGLRPMTHFDGGARPMFAAFTAKPDSKIYTVENPRIPLDERNPRL
jgi:hypothetical protein